MGEKFTSRVGYLIRNFRIASDMTQKELADYLGIRSEAYQRYEYGTREPDIKGLNKLANYYKVTVDYLLGRTDQK